MENDPFAFKLFLFPLNEEVTIGTLVSWTQKLIEKQKLISYHTQGKDGLYLANFHKHQTIKNPQPPEVPLLLGSAGSPIRAIPALAVMKSELLKTTKRPNTLKKSNVPTKQQMIKTSKFPSITKIHKTFKTWKTLPTRISLFLLLTLFLHLAYKINIKRI